MINKKFKQKSYLAIFYQGKKLGIFNDIRATKKWIYSSGIRGTTYEICETSEYGEILNKWLYKYKDSGVIFQMKIYSLWDEMVKKAKASEYEIPW